jgi:hypothetical protein
MKTSSPAHVRIVVAGDTLRFDTNAVGLGPLVTLPAGPVAIRARRLGYITGADTVTMRGGYIDTLGFGLRIAPLCLERVTSN